MFASADLTYRDTVRQVQQLVNILNPRANLLVDGVPGPVTVSTVASLGSSSRDLVKNLVSARNPSVAKDLVAVKEAPRPKGEWYDRPTIERLIDRAIALHGGVDVEGGAREYLLWLLDLEPRKTSIKGVVHYDARSVNGPYKGFYQIGPPAWTDVQRSKKIKDLPSDPLAVYDPWVNTAVALVYSQLLVTYLRVGYIRDGVPGFKGVITPEILYGAHNQGAVGLLRGAKNALQEKKQSASAIKVIASAVAQLKMA